MTRLLAGRSVELGRLSPDFRWVGRGARPLEDRYLSRKRPVLIRRSRDGSLSLEGPADGMSLVVDGVSVAGRLTVASAALQAGAVIELNDRVVLLLHLLGRPSEPADDLGMVGGSESMSHVREDVLHYADLDIPVLIRGESGTGKELVARSIHRRSPRASRPCLSVNMAAIQATTAASELFGHVRGAFTGATRDHRGYFERAHGGTLFLDEIVDAPPDVQAMLLRVLETGEIQPVGAPAFRSVDVRLVTATDADLESATKEGRFRMPLLHPSLGSRSRYPRFASAATTSPVFSCTFCARTWPSWEKRSISGRQDL